MKTENDGEAAEAYARAFKRSTGQPLIVPTGTAARMKAAGADVAKLEEEGCLVVQRPIPLTMGRGWWTRGK